MSPIYLLLVGLVVVIGGILVFRLHAILSLFLGALVVSFLTPNSLVQQYAITSGLSATDVSRLLEQTAGERIAFAFGRAAQSIAVLIVLASIMGKCLLESGAAERIVRTMVKILGERKTPVAYVLSSFLLGIPIFFDTVFYLMIPLARAMGARNRRAYALCVMAIIAGGSMAHSLVPPTPGPLFAAGAFHVNMGLMIVMGMIVGLACSSAGMIYGVWLNKRQDIPLRATADTSIEDLQRWLEKDTAQLPSFLVSNLPIALPVIFIAGKTILSNFAGTGPQHIEVFFRYAGDPVVALFVGTVIALLLLARQSSWDLRRLQKHVESAIGSAGTIILITCMGGAFGAMLQQTSIGNWLTGISSFHKLATLPLAFFVTAVIRTAQGSATVAMITAVGILTVLNAPGALGFHPVYLALVIGCGSKLFPWMNDSGFWIICKMSGFTERETVKNFSILLSVMGVTGLIACMVLANVFPLVGGAAGN
jgi:GntP family gluconate:H+ symporter